MNLLICKFFLKKLFVIKIRYYFPLPAQAQPPLFPPISPGPLGGGIGAIPPILPSPGAVASGIISQQPSSLFPTFITK